MMPVRGKTGSAESSQNNRYASLTQSDLAAAESSNSVSAQSDEVASNTSIQKTSTRATPKRAAKSKATNKEGSAFSTRKDAARISSPDKGKDTATPVSIKKAKAQSPAVQKAVNASAVSATPASGQDPTASKAYWKKIRERTVFSLLMIAGFLTILLMGPPYMILLVLLSETLVYREVTALFNIPGRASLTGSTQASQSQSEADDELDFDQRRVEKQRQELWSKTLSWYFFAVSNFFLYGESLNYYFKHIVNVDSLFIPFVRHHRFISFMLYIFGFMAFVTNLRRRNLKHQFGLFCWVHMSLLVIVFSSHFIVNNILEGMIWFWLPASLVICNDIFAYVCGMLFGRTPLINLSPKKTVEGFVGALLVTMVFAWIWAGIFQRFDYMVCPAVNLGMTAFSGITCERNPVFLPHQALLPEFLSKVLSSVAGRPITTFSWTPFQYHALVMAAFASLVAPFGGFFASGFKRAFNIKDFGASIPGHGGLTDRFDCQFIMGLFSYVYYSSLIRESHITVGHIMQTVVTQLPSDQQMQLLQELTQYLTSKGYF